MTFDESMREAAQRADKAVNRAIQKYRRELVTDEDDLTGVVVGNLDADLDGSIGGLTWTTSVVRHRKGKAAEEDQTGADLVIHVDLKTPERKFSKGVLIQAKRIEPGVKMNASEHSRLVEQCNKMLEITPASFVFDYAKSGVRCGAASRISGTSNRELHGECSWTSYRFFLELFRCPVGDPRITSALVRELPIPNIVKIRAVGD